MAAFTMIVLRTVAAKFQAVDGFVDYFQRFNCNFDRF